MRPAPPGAPRGHVPADAPAADALHRARLAAADAVASAERERIEALNAPRSKTVGTQSLYRESEAQTTPYEPEYFVPDRNERTAKQAALAERNATEGGAPELLSIRHLTFASGLPAGAAEAEHIEKMRAKRAFEASLPPLSDAASLPLRKRLMEEWEEAEWAEREMEIARLQEERLDILRRAIDAREEKAERVAEARLRRMRDGMLSEKHKKFASIQAKRLKALRKLGKNRAESFEDGDENKGSIVDEYADYASKKYVPDPVRGLVNHPTIDTTGYLPDGVSHGSLADAKAFYESIPTEAYEWDAETAMARVFDAPAPKVRVWEKSAGGGVEEKRAEALLDAMYEEMQREKREAAKAAKAAGGGDAAGVDAPVAVTPEPVTPGGDAIASTPKPVASKRGPERPETPTLPPPMESEEAAETYRAVVALQSLLRGRAEQNETFEGRERRRELIAELRLGEETSSSSGGGDVGTLGAESLKTIERAAGAAGAAILRVLAMKDPTARDAAFERTDLAARERDAAEMDRAAARIQAIQRGRVARRRAAAERSGGYPRSPGIPAPGAEPAPGVAAPGPRRVRRVGAGDDPEDSGGGRGRAARRSVECIRRGDDPDAWRRTPTASAVKERPLTPEEEEALDVAGLTPEEKAAVAKMQASARDLLLRGEATPEGFPGELSPAEAAAVAKIQASAKLHLARSDAVDAALNESASVEVNAAAVRDDASTRRLQATARAHLEMRGAAVVGVDASPRLVEDASPAMEHPLADADVDADVDLDVAALDLDSKEKVVTMQASARAHVERVRSAAASAADELAKDPTAAATRLAARPSRRASRRGGGLMRRDSFKRLELEGVWVPMRVPRVPIARRPPVRSPRMITWFR